MSPQLKWKFWQTVAVDLGLNYKAGTAEPNCLIRRPLPLMTHGWQCHAHNCRKIYPNHTNPYHAMPCHAHCPTIMSTKNLAALWVVKLLFRPTRGWHDIWRQFQLGCHSIWVSYHVFSCLGGQRKSVKIGQQLVYTGLTIAWIDPQHRCGDGPLWLPIRVWCH